MNKVEKQPDQSKAVEQKMMIANKVIGTVKWFNVKQGYGFINRNDTKEDVFVHQSAIVKNNPNKKVRSVGDDEVVMFDVVIGEQGYEAANVTGPAGKAVKGSSHAADKSRSRVAYSNRRRAQKNKRKKNQSQNCKSRGGQEGYEFCFHLKESATKGHLLVEACGKHVLSETTYRDWFKRFKDNNFDVSVKERPAQPKKFKNGKLKALLQEDSCQTLKELSEKLNVNESTVSKCLKEMGMIQKLGNWLPRELKEKDIVKRLTICELLFQRQKRKKFLHRIVTGGEKWIYYDNNPKGKSKTASLRPGEPSTSKPKQDSHGKVRLCIWWDQVGVVYYELLLQPNQTINAERYRQQLLNLSRALKEKRPQYAKRQDKIILLHARPHTKSVKEVLEALGWDVLPYPPFSPDVAPSNYHLFQSMQGGLSKQYFSSFEDIKKWLDDWIASKEPEFFYRGINLLPEKWEKVVASEGKYFK